MILVIIFPLAECLNLTSILVDWKWSANREKEVIHYNSMLESIFSWKKNFVIYTLQLIEKLTTVL